jgi:hypothetical protein
VSWLAQELPLVTETLTLIEFGRGPPETPVKVTLDGEIEITEGEGDDVVVPLTIDEYPERFPAASLARTR